MSHRTLLLVLLVLFSSPKFAEASQRQCHLLSAMSGYDIQGCTCTSNLSAYPFSGSKMLPLVAVCGYEKESWGFTGAFYLEGTILLSGEIRREDTITFGDRPIFVVSESSKKLLPTRERSLRFIKEQVAIEKFRVPSIGSNSPCWTAKASILLNKLYVLEGPGTDADGSYIVDFSVSEVGTFKKCTPDR